MSGLERIQAITTAHADYTKKALQDGSEFITKLTSLKAPADFGLESGNVIGLRMLKFSCGDSDALNEMHLMMGEKVNAVFEMGANLLAGGSADSVAPRHSRQAALPG